MTPAGHRRLILTRHAKSAWDDPAVNDHDRTLNGRGRRSGLELGEWLQSRGYEPHCLHRRSRLHRRDGCVKGTAVSSSLSIAKPVHRTREFVKREVHLLLRPVIL